VDTTTERRILENFAREDAGATSIVVSHRLSAVMGANEILVLDGGCTVERGTHAGLLSQDGLYARLWAFQAGEVGRSDEVPPDPAAGSGILEVLRGQDERAVRSEVEEEA
jgi:ATP-binding cassette subfamily B protein